MLKVKWGTKMGMLEISTKFALVLLVISIISVIINPIKSMGFYLSLAAMVISLGVAIAGFTIIHLRSKKGKKEDKDKWKNYLDLPFY